MSLQHKTNFVYDELYITAEPGDLILYEPNITGLRLAISTVNGVLCNVVFYQNKDTHLEFNAHGVGIWPWKVERAPTQPNSTRHAGERAPTHDPPE